MTLDTFSLGCLVALAGVWFLGTLPVLRPETQDGTLAILLLLAVYLAR